MTRSPLLNALLSILYIVFVSAIIYYGTSFRIGESSLLAPIALISLFTLSAATMAYLFLYYPFKLYFSHQPKTAIHLFLQTLIIFGVITALIFTWLCWGVFTQK